MPKFNPMPDGSITTYPYVLNRLVNHPNAMLIPRVFQKELNIETHTKLKMRIVDGSIVVTPVRRKSSA